MWVIVGQGPTVLSIVQVGVFRFFSLSPTTSIFFPPLCGRRLDKD